MKATKLGWISLVAAALIGTAAAQAPQQQTPPSPQKQQQQPRQGGTMKPTPSATMPTQDPAVLRDIETTMGFVPQWMRMLPPALLPGFWQGVKSLEMSTETRLDNKTKELIGLAVAAQVPCDYCVMFHTQAARMNGATDQEIQEAVGMAAITRQGSTLLNGMMIDKAQFRKDLDRMARGKQQAQK
jgi:AhpD family alkylhydroperoxidase